jgi:hypothetical protein
MKLGCRRTIWNGLAMAMLCLLGVVWARGQSSPAAGPATAAAKRQTAGARTAQAGHGAQTAEQVFKKVDVLKGISVDEFMDTMGFFAASLSWNCTD